MAFLHRILNRIFGRDEVPSVVSCPDHHDGEPSQADGMKPQEKEQEPENIGLHFEKWAQIGREEPGDHEERGTPAAPTPTPTPTSTSVSTPAPEPTTASAPTPTSETVSTPTPESASIQTSTPTSESTSAAASGDPEEDQTPEEAPGQEPGQIPAEEPEPGSLEAWKREQLRKLRRR